MRSKSLTARSLVIGPGIGRFGFTEYLLLRPSRVLNRYPSLSSSAMMRRTGLSVIPSRTPIWAALILDSVATRTKTAAWLLKKFHEDMGTPWLTNLSDWENHANINHALQNMLLSTGKVCSVPLIIAASSNFICRYLRSSWPFWYLLLMALLCHRFRTLECYSVSSNY